MLVTIVGDMFLKMLSSTFLIPSLPVFAGTACSPLEIYPCFSFEIASLFEAHALGVLFKLGFESIPSSNWGPVTISSSVKIDDREWKGGNICDSAIWEKCKNHWWILNSNFQTKMMWLEVLTCL